MSEPTAFSLDLIICAACWPRVVKALAPMSRSGCPGSWDDDPDDAEACDICGKKLGDE